MKGKITFNTKWVYKILCVFIDSNPGFWASEMMRVNDKIFKKVDGGVHIYPKDGSYRRFISDRWYDGVNPESL